MPVLTSKQRSWFQTNQQVREHFEEAKLLELGESMKAIGQLQPVLAKPDGTLIAGERRLRAATLVGLPELQVIITEEPLTDTQIKVIQLSENLQRADLKDAEKWRAFEKLLSLNPGWSNKELAAHLKLGESTVTKYLSPSRCIPEVQKALESGQIGITAVYEISRVPADQQAELLRLKLSGTSRDGLAEHVRKQKRDAAPQVRVKRIACVLPSGVSIVASGPELSLDDLIEALGEAQKEAKKAREHGYTAKTFAAAMKDRSKAGN